VDEAALPTLKMGIEEFRVEKESIQDELWEEQARKMAPLMAEAKQRALIILRQALATAEEQYGMSHPITAKIV
jgi:hypothetical protein